MIDEFEFVNKNGQSLFFNTEAIPFKRLTMEVELAYEDVKRPQEHGIYLGYTYLGKRIIRAEGDIFGEDSDEYNLRRAEMMSVLMPYPELYGRAVGDLYIKYTGIASRLTCECTLEGWPELPMEALAPARGEYLVQWKAYDPRLYEEVASEIILTTVGFSVTGRTYNKTYPRSYAAASTFSGTAFISGDVDTSPVITFTGPCTGPVVQATSAIYGISKEFTMLGLVLGASDSVVVDFRKKTAVMNGTADVAYYTKGADWFKLYPNDTVTLRYAPVAYAPGGAARVQWHNAYML